MRRRGRPKHPDILTPREVEVLDLIRCGLSNREIADRLGLSLAGAKFHVSEIISKLGVTSREEAARMPLPDGMRRILGSILTRLPGGPITKGALGASVAAGAGALLCLFVLALSNLKDDRTAAPLGKVAFVRDGNLWVRSLSSGKELQLTTHGAAARPKFSPSGEWMIYSHGPPADPKDIGPHVVRADGSGDRRLDAVGIPAWSPARDVLAFAQADGALFAENADGTHRRQLLPAVPDGGTLDRRLDLDWSSDGEWVLYEEQHQDHVAPRGGFAYVGIRAVRADGTNEHELYSARVTGGTADFSSLPFRWGPFGSAVAVSVEKGTGGPTHAGGLPLALRIVPGPGTKEGAIDMLSYKDFAAVSPDGRRIALVAGLALRGYPPQASSPTPATASVPPPRDAQSQKEIVLMDANTGQVTPLSPAGMVAVSPSWSPNGRSLAFVARSDTGLSISHSQRRARKRRAASGPWAATAPTWRLWRSIAPTAARSGRYGRPTPRTLSLLASTAS